MNSPVEKKCSKCGEIKDSSEFHLSKTSSDGLKSACKSCRCSYSRDYHNKNRLAILAKSKIYRAEHKQEIKLKKKEFHIKNIEKIKEAKRKYHVNNRKRIIAKSKKWVEENRERSNKYSKISQRIDREALHDEYIYRLLSKSSSLDRSDYPKELIQINVNIYLLNSVTGVNG